MRPVLCFLLYFCFFHTQGTAQSEFLNVIEKELVKVGNKLYATKFEISNAQYNIFLGHLADHNRIPDLEKARPDSIQWNQAGPEFIPLGKFYLRHPSYAGYPVVNISHDAAILFCEWLTDQYMAYTGRIFRNVRFRLPTEYEWENAARGGVKGIVYPWGSDRAINDEGTALCNFWQYENAEGAAEENRTEVAEDFATVSAPVSSYFPNGFGLYNVSGNVAEMTSRKGVARGGSWRSGEVEVRIDARQNYDGPSPFVGFRVFMDVLEE